MSLKTVPKNFEVKSNPACLQLSPQKFFESNTTFNISLFPSLAPCLMIHFQICVNYWHKTVTSPEMIVLKTRKSLLPAVKSIYKKNSFSASSLDIKREFFFSPALPVRVLSLMFSVPRVLLFFLNIAKNIH